MLSSDIPWTFSDTIGQERIRALEAPPPFENILKDIKEQMQFVCFHNEPCDERDGYSRFMFCIRIDQIVFDLFFNSSQGYRSWYFRSAENGISKNFYAIKLLSQPLFSRLLEPELTRARFSLSKKSTKIWLAESSKKCCDLCSEWADPKDDRIEIFNNRWEKINDGTERNGRTAPYLTKLRLIGGFINEGGAEYVSKDKQNRAQKIHDCGWA